MHSSFIETIKTLADVPDTQVPYILAIAKVRQLKRNDSFVSKGQVPTELAFNVHGLFRYYYLDEQGREFTKGFFLENSFLSSYSAMIRHQASHFYIQALEDSTLLTFEYHQWKRLLTEHPCWNHLLIALLERGYATKETREREFLLDDAETRYQAFLQKFPELEKRVKQHHIASYLGITPVALSRIRNKIKFI